VRFLSGESGRTRRGNAPDTEHGDVPLLTRPQSRPLRSEPRPAAPRGRRLQATPALAAGGVALAVACAVLVALGPGPSGNVALDAPRAVVLGVVEGVTEFLPVSSTGHLVVTERLLGLGGNARELAALDSYAVIIQGGAILAVAWLFWRRLVGAATALVAMLHVRRFSPDVAPGDRRLAIAIVVAAAPAGLIGFSAGDLIQHHLFSPAPIALAWIVGGAALLGLAGWLHHRSSSGDGGGIGLDQVSWQQALVIGLAQALALWPGVSRSLVTIVAGCLVGLALPAAVELSFLLGFVVLLAASGLEILRHGGDIIATYGWVNPLLGLAVAFISAVVAIRWLLRIISGKSLAGFGWYRLGAGLLTLGLLGAGRL
jgi:undecaprenyl-diphosphatase